MARINSNESQKKPSIHISSSDAEIAEKLGWGNQSPSTTYSDALEKAEKYRERKMEKKRELQKRMSEIRSEAEKWGIDI